MDKARSTAVAVIRRVFDDGAYANIELSNALKDGKFSDLDRRFCTTLVNGTVKCGRSLDWIISRYVHRPIDSLDGNVMAILRIGVFQLFFLDKVPPSAIVNEAVEIAKRICPAATKFINGVLRTMTREPDKGQFPIDDSPASLALRTFHPRWLVERWIKQFGIEQTKMLLEIDNQPAPLTLRVNRLKTTRAELIDMLRSLGVEAQPSEQTEDGIVCFKIKSLSDLPPLKNGLCMVQDESSMRVAHVLDPKPDEFVIDCCAAPGGKTTHIAELMNDRGLVISIDVHEHKLKLIGGNAQRLGLTIVKPMQLDAREVGDEFKAKADRVLVDAPCSGLGVLRRKVDLRWRKDPKDFDRLRELQSAILESASRALKSDGTMVYSTCTLEREENEGIVEKFLAAHDDFALVEKRTFMPHLDGTDGFFYAKLHRST